MQWMRNVNDTMSPQHKPDLLKWIGFNLVLLGCYLGFFYLCLALEFPWSLLIGWGMAGVVTGLCFRFRALFLNRYEFLFYLVLPLDMVLEGLIPEHVGYSFYLCAASFWFVFIVYRIYVSMGFQKTQSPPPCQ